MLSGEVSCSIDWTKEIIPTKAYAYLDKNKSLGHLDTKICKTKTQSFQIWPKPFIKSFRSSSGS